MSGGCLLPTLRVNVQKDAQRTSMRFNFGRVLDTNNPPASSTYLPRRSAGQICHPHILPLQAFTCVTNGSKMVTARPHPANTAP